MRTVSAMDMRRRLGEILDAAAAGERIIIERDHRPLAYLVPVEDGRRLSDARDAIRERRLRALDEIVEVASRIREKYPQGPDAATAVRMDRDRDDLDGDR